MNSGPIPLPDPASAVAALEAWFDTVRAPDGVTGPAIGFRANCLGWCGPSFDWRLEGLLDAQAVRAEATGDPRYLDRIVDDVRALLAARLGDGSFRNSYFEWNPFEGGMPHEPAVLAAALRVRRVVAAAGRTMPGLEDAVGEAIERRYLGLLWNKTLRTVRDWEISDYQFGPSISAAAVLDLLHEWDALMGTEAHAERAADLARWIRGLQEQSGPWAGGIHTSNRRGGGISPFYTARCLGPLRRHARRTGCADSARAADRAADFLIGQQLPEGGFRRLVWSWRPPSAVPVHSGMSAAILAALWVEGCLPQADLARQERWLLGLATPSGAFRNAIGYGRLRARPDRSEWRDWMPCPGWQDKIHHFFCLRAGSATATFQPVAWETSTRVGHVSGSFHESPEMVEVRRNGVPVYHWAKKSVVPSICRLT